MPNSGNPQSGPICPKCRRSNRTGAAYCTHCGYNLLGNGSQPIAPSPSSPADFPSLHYDKVSADVTGNLPSGLTLKRRYRILRKIAQGGMGAVYEANDTDAPAGTRWAVKEISPASMPPTERSQSIADFRREAQILATLQHPNLPHVVETFEELGKHFLVMEFVAGRTLLNTVEGQTDYLPEERVRVWARQLFEVLHYLHSQRPPIIYRDLKPANIMLVEGTERIKLIDFGIARFHKAGKNRDTEAFGTAGYAPPEQYGKGQTDQRSDIYALGATLHHLITRHDPSLNPFNWLPIRRYRNDISPQIEAAIMRAVNLDPQKRFASIRDFAEAMGLGITGALAPKATDDRRWPIGTSASRTQPSLPSQPLPPTQPKPTPIQPAASWSEAQSQQPIGNSLEKQLPAQPQPQLQPQPAMQAPIAAPPQASKPAKSRSRPTTVAPNLAPQLDILTPPLPTLTSLPPIAASARPPAPVQLDMGEALWNRRPVKRLSLKSADGSPLRGTVVASHPWIAYSPHRLSGNAVTLEVGVRRSALPFGRAQLQVPNLFGIIWQRTRWFLPFIGCWFWLLFLFASAAGRLLMWGALAIVGAVILAEALIWLWTRHARIFVPTPRENTGKLLVKSNDGDRHIEVRVLAKPSGLRTALGWTLAALFFIVEIATVTWIALSLAGVSVTLPGMFGG